MRWRTDSGMIMVAAGIGVLVAATPVDFGKSRERRAALVREAHLPNHGGFRYRDRRRIAEV
jgi:hypothetical protein